ncbi:MAG: outer membrane protein [Candidatus Spyradosoma sp.]
MKNAFLEKTTKRAAGTLALMLAATALAAETDTAVFSSEKEPLGCAVSLDLVYASATASASRGGVDMAGLDARVARKIDDVSRLDVGLLMLGGEEDFYDDDISSSTVALLGGYRATFDLVPDRLTLYAGARVGIAVVGYEIDEGRSGGWDHYSRDSDVCLAYAGEVGFTYAFTEKWAVHGGYSYFGNTASVGGSDLKFRDQQYHMFSLGAEYRF